MNNKKADGGLKTKMHLNHILPIPTIIHPISAPSFRRVTTIKHCCPSRKSKVVYDITFRFAHKYLKRGDRTAIEDTGERVHRRRRSSRTNDQSPTELTKQSPRVMIGYLLQTPPIANQCNEFARQGIVERVSESTSFSSS